MESEYLPIDFSAEFIKITTFPPGKWRSYRKSMQSWLMGGEEQIYAMVNGEEYEIMSDSGISNVAGFVKPILYEESIGSLTNKSVRRKVTPSLKAVLEAFDRVSIRYKCMVFFNADIELVGTDAGLLLERAVRKSVREKKAIFFNRLDIDPDDWSSRKYYMEGFDVFILPRELAKEIRLESLKGFYIGQVGWDYALPLALPAKHVLRSCSLHITHLTHPTGSTQSWGAAMKKLYYIVDETHTSGLVARRLLCRWQILCSAAVSSLLRGLKEAERSKLTRCIDWLDSRIVFYVLLKKCLERIEVY